MLYKHSEQRLYCLALLSLQNPPTSLQPIYHFVIELILLNALNTSGAKHDFGFFRIIELFRLEETVKIIESNH